MFFLFFGPRPPMLFFFFKNFGLGPALDTQNGKLLNETGLKRFFFPFKTLEKTFFKNFGQNPPKLKNLMGAFFSPGKRGPKSQKGK